MKAKKFPALDDFRLIAVILVVANHTRSADGEFLWLLTVLRRVSVPFFIMVSGYFLACGNWRSTGKFLTKTAMLYGVGVCELEERQLISTENTTVTTRGGMKRNGNLLYTIRPIQLALNQFYEQQLAQMDVAAERQRVAKELALRSDKRSSA